MRRGVPAIRVRGRLVTTVLDLMLATYGVRRDGLPGEWPAYDDATQPHTPAWQEAITSVDRHLAVKVAREFARNAEVSGGRSMICMGAGTNHWFHSDETYRAFIALLLLGGCVASTAAAGPIMSGRRRSARSPAGRRWRSRWTGAARRARRRARPGSISTPSSGAMTGCGRSASRRRSAPACSRA